MLDKVRTTIDDEEDDHEDGNTKKSEDDALPVDRPYVLEYNLCGDGEQHAKILQEPLVPQQPRTVRIYLCPGSGIARNVLQELGDDRGAAYIGKNMSSSIGSKDEEKKAKTEDNRAHNFQWDGYQCIAQYDPSFIFDCPRMDINKQITYMFPEFVGTLHGRTQWVVQNLVRFVQSDEEKLSIVWYDFRDLYHLSYYYFRDTNEEPEHLSICRKNFAKKITSDRPLPFQKAKCVPEFVAFFLLELLEQDVAQHQKSVYLNSNDLPLRFMFDVYHEETYVLKDILKERVQWAQFRRQRKDKMDGVSSFLKYMREEDMVSSYVSDARCREFQQELRRLIVKTSFLADQMQRQDSAAENFLTLYGQVTQVRTTESTTNLTSLAVVFIPLSLATGILSMQNRFKDLGVKIYDFFGVAAIFITVAVVAYALRIRISELLLQSWYFNSTKKEHAPYRHIPFFLRTWGGLAVLGWCVVVASFIVGMFDDLRKGLKIMGVGLALPLSPFILSLWGLCIMLCMWGYMSLFGSKVRSEEKDTQIV